jgi:hypothetical protein
VQPELWLRALITTTTTTTNNNICVFVGFIVLINENDTMNNRVTTTY